MVILSYKVMVPQKNMKPNVVYIVDSIGSLNQVLKRIEVGVLIVLMLRVAEKNVTPVFLI